MCGLLLNRCTIRILDDGLNSIKKRRLLAKFSIKAVTRTTWVQRNFSSQFYVQTRYVLFGLRTFLPGMHFFHPF